MNNIVLVGFMAVGKSTIGKSLKEILSYPLFDLDTLVDNEEKMAINEIFANKGEAYFRTKEIEIAKKLLDRNNNIISTGGGLFLNQEIREIALKNNFVVFLNLNIEEVYMRIKRNDLRPLAKKKSREDLNSLFQQRLPYYKLANIEIDVNNKTPNMIAEEIKLEYFKWLNKEI